VRAFITQKEEIDKHGTLVDVLESDYIRYFESFNLELEIVSNFSMSQLVIEEDDLIILSGGGSIAPHNFKSKLNNLKQSNRDELENRLLIKALETKTPILGICRGFQFINLHLGGEVSELSYQVPRLIGVEHQVDFANGKKVWVNNYHHDGIPLNNLADVLFVVATDPENQHVEGFYHPEYKWLGIQWHPERTLKDDYSRYEVDQLIQQFINNKGVLDESYYTRGRPRD